MKTNHGLFLGFAVLFAAVMFSFTGCDDGSGDPNPGTTDPTALTGTVSIKGTAKVGETLTADITRLDGSGDIAYQWWKGTVTDKPTDRVVTTATYKLVEDDQDKYFWVVVTRAGSTGSKMSTGVGPVLNANAVPSTGVTVSPATATVSKGETQQFTATVTSTGAALTVTWTVTGGIEGTGISVGGLLTVAATETATTLTVKATSAVDSAKSGTATVTVGSTPSGVTWTAVSDSTFGNTTIRDIAYGGGKFVAVGDSGKMAYSSNGESWTLVSNSTFGNTTIYGIAYGGVSGSEKFVAVGDSGKMAYSTDGETWDPKQQLNFTVRDIAYGSGKFVAVGGDIAYSSDGESWTSFFTPHLNNLTGIAYGGGKFIAVGREAKVWTSSSVTSSSSWTQIYENGVFGASNTTDLNGIAYGGGKYVVVGTNRKIVSGTPWKSVSTSIDPINGIAYGGGKFVAGGQSGKMVYSSNGETWTSVSDSTFGNTTIYGIAYGGVSGSEKFVAVGNSGKMAYSNSQE